MHNSGPRRNHLEVVECSLAPAQELVALCIALVFKLNVALSGISGTSDINNDRVVDDHFRWCKRVDLLRISPEGGNCLTHGRKVNDARNTGEVLHNHSGRGKLNLGVRLGGWIPVHQSVHVVASNVRAILSAKHVLQENLEAVGQLVHTKFRHGEVLIALFANRKILSGIKAVTHD